VRILRTIRRHGLVGEGDRVAIAVSGGGDSVALVWLLQEIAQAGRLPGTIAGLIHVNHQLRGAESARDEAFCRTLASRLDWRLEVGSFDVAARARETHRSIEAAAREIRYGFLAEAAARLGATRVATAHTLEDQAETVLLRLLRGAGARGMGGIRVRRGIFIRPALDCRRAELRRYLQAHGESFCEDSSNLDASVPRNRVRHQLLPVVEEIAPGGITALARFASLAAEDEAYLEQVAAEAASSVRLRESVFHNSGKKSTPGVVLDAKALAGLPKPLGRRVLRQAIAQVAPAAGLTAVHLQALLELAAGDRASGHLDLPGLQVERRGPTLCMDAADSVASRPGAGFEAILTVPGCVDIKEAGLTIAAALENRPAWTPDPGHPHDRAAIQASSVQLPLNVRFRRPGDRFRPLGAPGRRKLQDLLVDRKVPRQDRDHVPLVVDAAGRIVWVVGLAIAEDCRVTSPATGVVVLKAERKVLS
jgi:tRNA(Ile)-lysidine synthase